MNSTTNEELQMTKPLTLIVATTVSLGIGRGGTLPWPQLKQEMAYFAHVTKRAPPSSLRSSPSGASMNAVVMGRKTWDSIPPRFRPLKGRLNVVISRSMAAPSSISEEGPVVASSLDKALKTLEQHDSLKTKTLGDVFVIGGSSIYATALSHPQARRVLLTKILEPEYDCDTFFPLDLDGEDAKSKGWQQQDDEALVRFVGEEALSDKGVERFKVKEKDVKWKYCMYERDGLASS